MAGKTQAGKPSSGTAAKPAARPVAKAPSRGRRRRRRKPKNHMPVIVVSVLLIVGALAALWYFNSQGNEPSTADTQTINLYFVNSTTNEWEAEKRQIALGESKDMVGAALNQLAAGPRAATLARSVPPGLIVKAAFISGERENNAGQKEAYNIVEVELSEDYFDLTGVAPVVCRNAIVYTLTELAFVHDVRFYVGESELLKPNGQAVGLLNRNNVLLGNTPISPADMEMLDIVIYFADGDVLALGAEVRTVEMSMNKQREMYIVEELLKGPRSEDLIPTIPADTKLRGVSTDGNICYVDFSQDFVTKFDGGSSVERLMLYSIVNSLTELPHIKRVKFLAEGDSITEAKNFQMNLSNSFERDAELVPAP